MVCPIAFGICVMDAFDQGGGEGGGGKTLPTHCILDVEEKLGGGGGGGGGVVIKLTCGGGADVGEVKISPECEAGDGDRNCTFWLYCGGRGGGE